ncbi:MAG TPA: hypothetical protein VEX64_00110, partial [Pyrinomonadaceae bacterium]|nr:hypothetical protein [Pyrinomonadaceae bacterium]
LKNGVLETKLAGRVSQQASNFTDLLALERRAAILQHGSADSEENAARLKKLFALSNVLTAGTKDETALAEAVKDFVAGDDAARTHRNLYAANRLLNERIALPQAFELMQTATSGVDEATEIPAASAAVLADELFESRRLAAIRGEIVTVPDLPRNTLTNILRGRIEEIAGWTLYNQDKPEEAVVRLKRAVGILPADSTWWRSSQWRLGAALDKSGKGREALEAYVKSYRSGEPDPTRRTIIESTYVRVYGSTKGLDAKLGEQIAQSEASQPAPAPRTVSLSKNPLPEVIAQINKTSQPETRQSELPKEIISQPEQTSETTKVEIQPAIPEIVAEEAPIKPERTVTPEAAKPDVTPQSPEPEPTPESVSLEPEAKSEADDQTVEPVAKAEPVKTPLPEEVAKTDSQKSNDLVKVTQNSPRPRVLLIDRLKNTVTEIQPSPVKTGSAEKEPKGEKTSLSPEVAGETAQPKSTEAEPQTEEETGRKDRSRAASCAIWTSQDTISLLSAGGRVALLVGIEGAETADGLTADTSSPGDIEVKIDKDASKTSNRLLYEIRSISEKKGIFAVRFESDCGEKIVKVKVR